MDLMYLYILPKLNWNYANYRDAKEELTGSHIEFMLIIEMAKIKLTRGHIGIMLIIEMAKIELTGGHIEIMLIIIYIDYQNRIN